LKRLGIAARVALLLVLGALEAGCAVTDTSRYYALGAFQAPPAVDRPAAEPGLTIGIGPVAIPGYLDRPQLVTRDVADGLEIWPYHRWAEPLDLGIAEALANHLSARVPGDRVAVFPWRGAFARIIDYQVVMAVARFEGSPGRSVTLDARWRLLTRDGKEVAFKRTTLTEPITGDGFPALVAAMNRTIGSLGREVGEAIRSQSANRAAIRD
jgi:uncharacterized lipoprotein YmbA